MPIVECPYDKNHKMSQTRLQWHLVKCKAKISRQQLNLPEYHCKFNYLHIFFTEEEIQKHETKCQQEFDLKAKNRKEKQNSLNKELEMGEGQSEQFIAYRASQMVDERVKLWNDRSHEQVEKVKDWDKGSSEDGEIP